MHVWAAWIEEWIHMPPPPADGRYTCVNACPIPTPAPDGRYTCVNACSIPTPAPDGRHTCVNACPIPAPAPDAAPLMKLLVNAQRLSGWGGGVG